MFTHSIFISILGVIIQLQKECCQCMNAYHLQVLFNNNFTELITILTFRTWIWRFPQLMREILDVCPSMSIYSLFNMFCSCLYFFKTLIKQCICETLSLSCTSLVRNNSQADNKQTKTAIFILFKQHLEQNGPKSLGLLPI